VAYLSAAKLFSAQSLRRNSLPRTPSMDYHYLVDNIESSHPNIYIANDAYIYHINYLPYRIAYYCIIHSATTLDYLPLNCSAITIIGNTTPGMKLYNLPPLILYFRGEYRNSLLAKYNLKYWMGKVPAFKKEYYNVFCDKLYEYCWHSISHIIYIM
jgi:hypothetical protein